MGRQLREEGPGLAPEVQQAVRQAAVRQQARQGTFRIGGGGLQVRQGHVEARIGRPGQAQAHEVAPGGIDAGGLGVQAEAASGPAGGDGAFQLREAGSGPVGAGVA